MSESVSEVNRWHQEHGLALWGKGHVKNVAGIKLEKEIWCKGVRGEVGLGDYPRIPQVINEIKGFAKIYLTKGIRLKKNYPPPLPNQYPHATQCPTLKSLPKWM